MKRAHAKKHLMPTRSGISSHGSRNQFLFDIRVRIAFHAPALLNGTLRLIMLFGIKRGWFECADKSSFNVKEPSSEAWFVEPPIDGAVAFGCAVAPCGPPDLEATGFNVMICRSVAFGRWFNEFHSML